MKRKIVSLSQPSLINWNSYFELGKCVREWEIEYKKHSLTFNPINTMEQKIIRGFFINPRDEGDKIYKKARFILANLEFERKKFQINLHNNILQSLLPRFYGPSWKTCKLDVMKRLGIKEIVPFQGIVFPRQSGKTTSMIMMFCALIACLKNFRILIVTPGEKTSLTILENFNQMWKQQMLGHHKHLVSHLALIKDNVTSMTWQESDGSISKIQAVAPTDSVSYRKKTGVVVVVVIIVYYCHLNGISQSNSLLFFMFSRRVHGK